MNRRAFWQLLGFAALAPFLPRAAGEDKSAALVVNVADGDPEFNKRAVMRAIQESKSRAVYEAVLAVEERNLRR